MEFTSVFRQKKHRNQIVTKLKKELITFQFFCNFRNTLLSSKSRSDPFLNRLTGQQKFIKRFFFNCKRNFFIRDY